MASLEPLPLRVGRESDPGKVRERNEDDFGYFVGGDRRLFVVADGMGGEAGGQEASRAAIASARALFEAEEGKSRPVRELLEAIVAEANAAILTRQAESPELQGMGTTLEVLLLEGDRASWAHVGDSRIYRVRGGKPERLTKDHTRIQQMLDGGLLTPEEAAEHPQRNVLSRAVGREGSLSPDIVVDEPIREGDAFLLCSDGLCDLVRDDEIAWFVDRSEPQDACRRLVRTALDRGGHDNVTVLVAYKGKPRSIWKRASTLVSLPPRISRKRSPLKVAALGIVLVALALAGSWAYFGSVAAHPSKLATPTKPQGIPKSAPTAVPKAGLPLRAAPSPSEGTAAVVNAAMPSTPSSGKVVALPPSPPPSEGRGKTP